MIDIAASHVRSDIASDVRKAGLFSLICDEVSDVGNHEWITVVMRYVKHDQICESLLAIYIVPITSLTASDLCDTVTTTLKTHGIDISNIVGQCYDGASNMSGQYGGLQAKIKDIAGDKAVYIHCYAHALNLVVCSAMLENKLASHIFGVLQKLYAFIERTPKRHHRYVESLEKHCSDKGGKKKLQSLSDTRWSSRADNLAVVTNCLPAILDALSGIQSDPEAVGLLSAFRRFDFLLGINVLSDILGYCKAASDYLQHDDLDLGAATLSVADLTLQMQSLRSDDNFEKYMESTKKMAQKNAAFGVQLDEKHIEDHYRKRKVPAKVKDGVTDRFLSGVDVTNASDRLRIDFYFAVIDCVLTSLHRRFGERSATINNGIKALLSLPCVPQSSQGDDLCANLRRFAEMYNCNADECVRQYKLVANNKLVVEPQNCLKAVWSLFCAHDLRRLYEDLALLLQISVTLRVTSATAERVHSKLKLAKSVMRATSDNDRMSNLDQLYVESDRTMN